MDKKALLSQVETAASEKIITADELMSAYHRGAGVTTPITNHEEKHASLSDILYYVGGAIVFTGIAVMISGSWDSFGVAARILLTFGAAIVAYVLGVLFSRKETAEGLSTAFFFISALVMPIGLFVIFLNSNIDPYTASWQTIIGIILLLVYGASFALYRKGIFLFFSIVFGSWLFMSFTNFIAGGAPIFGGNFSLYRILALGLSYMFLGYALAQTRYKDMSGWLYGFGALGFLGSALALGGWSPNQNIFFEVIYPALVFGILFLSISVKSRAFLVWGAIFLMAYILKITAEYFSEGLGWPLALVLAGLMLIAVGYYTVYINRKYLAQSS